EGIGRPINDGLTGEVLRTGKELMLNHPGAHPHWSWPSEWPHVFGAITIVPIIVEGRCVGTLEAIEREHHLIDEADVSMMRAVAEQIGAALRGVALREESMLRAQRMAVALEVAQAVADGTSLEEILQAATLGAYRAVPWTGEKEGVVDTDRGGGCLGGMRAAPGYGSSGMVFPPARQLVVGDAATRTDIPAWIHSDDPRYESILGTPVIV